MSADRLGPSSKNVTVLAAPTVCGFAALVFAFATLSGCDDKSSYNYRSEKTIESKSSVDRVTAPTTAAEPSSAGFEQSNQAAATGIAPAKASDRKIIYTAELQLVTDDFDKTEKGIQSLLSQHNGYLSDGSVERTSGQRRSGRWVARVPIGSFAGFLDQVSLLGIAESRRQNAQEVTEEYIDLQSRIATSKRLEDRILKLLDERTGNIKETIEVEQQLARVRTEVERMEGRLRYLSDRTDLATITILAREEQNYQPPETPTFATRFQQSWDNSITNLQDTGENVAIASVSAAPWVLIGAVFAVPAIMVVRRKWRRRFGSGSIEY